MKKVICLQCNIEFVNKSYTERKYCSYKCSGQRNSISLLEKFETYVIKNSGDQCWSWKGHTAHGGYGMTSNNNKGLRAHRASWIIHYGEIPEGLFVLHHCDNPICSNPKHLFLGTAKDNMQDCKSKGRNRHIPHPGEKNATSKLTNEIVNEIRKLAEQGIRSSEIAKKFNISHRHINRIEKSDAWAHLPSEYSLISHTKLNKEKVFKIRELLNSNCFYSTIAKMFNVSKTTISHIKRGKTWSHV